MPAQGNVIARVASSHGTQANWVAWIQNANGFACSRKRPNASNEGTARMWMEICSASPAADRWCSILMSSPGRWTLAVAGSRSFAGAVALNSAKMHLQLRVEALSLRPHATLMTDDLTHKIINWASQIASRAAALPSRQERDGYLADRQRELAAGAIAEGTNPRDAEILAETCVSAARRIMTELLARRAGVPHGRA